jgi:hypothetical protein
VIPASCFVGPTFRELNRSRVFVGAGSLGDGLRLLDRFYLAPVMCWRICAAIAAVTERQKELIGLSMFGVASTAVFRDLDKPECFCFPDCRRYETCRYPVRYQILLGHRQAAVIIATVIGKLDFNSGNDTVRR